MSAGKDFQLVRMKSGKHTFEVMTNPGSVHKFRKGELSIDQVLYTEMIFKNQVFANKKKNKKQKQKQILSFFSHLLPIPTTEQSRKGQ